MTQSLGSVVQSTHGQILNVDCSLDEFFLAFWLCLTLAHIHLLHHVRLTSLPLQPQYKVIVKKNSPCLPQLLLEKKVLKLDKHT
jgi:hypothetical protein